MERATRIFEDLQEQSSAGVPIVVEGRRDEAALRRLGIKGTILCLKATGEPRFRFIERLDGAKRAIVLTDFDRKGAELGTWLYQELSHRGIFADNQVWRKIRGLARTEVRSVEELRFWRGRVSSSILDCLQRFRGVIAPGIARFPAPLLSCQNQLVQLLAWLHRAVL